MRLNPEIVGTSLKKNKYKDNVIDEIKECIRIKNALDDFKDSEGLNKW